MKYFLGTTTGLQIKPVTVYDKAYPRIRALYREAFPAEERYPLFLLRLGAWKPEIEFSGVYDGEELCGLVFTIEAEPFLYVMYLAVDACTRGKGYGTRIIQTLREAYPRCQLVLEIEPLDKQASNYDQRVKRLAFYERNGFHRVGYDMFEGSVRYTVLADGEFRCDDFCKALRKITHGLYNFKVYPTSQQGVCDVG